MSFYNIAFVAVAKWFENKWSITFNWFYWLQRSKVKNILLFNYLECGSPSVSTGHVIGGINAPHGAFPWQINLLEHGSTICGGSILTPTWILTAAHCVLDQRTQQVKSSSILKVR